MAFLSYEIPFSLRVPLRILCGSLCKLLLLIAQSTSTKVTRAPKLSLVHKIQHNLSIFEVWKQYQKPIAKK